MNQFDRLVVPDLALDWGDGSVETVAGGGERAVSHTYAAAGDYVVEAVAADDDGGKSAPARHALTVTAAPVVIASPPASTPLRIRKLAVAPRCIRAADLRAQAARTVAVSFEMSAAATVRISMLRRTNKRVRSACPVPRINPKPGPHVQGIFGPHAHRDVVARAGVNRVTLAATGRRGRLLRPGTYRVPVTAAGATATRRLWVLPPR